VTRVWAIRLSSRPSTSEGFETLAHEVVHVVQQSRGPVAGVEADGLRISERSDHDEGAAQRAADQAVRGSPAAGKKAASRRVRRASEQSSLDSRVHASRRHDVDQADR